jgi:hypothetical protein
VPPESPGGELRGDLLSGVRAFPLSSTAELRPVKAMVPGSNPGVGAGGTRPRPPMSGIDTPDVKSTLVSSLCH